MIDDKTRRLAVISGFQESHRMKEYRCSAGHIFYSTMDWLPEQVEFNCVTCTVAKWKRPSRGPRGVASTLRGDNQSATNHSIQAQKVDAAEGPSLDPTSIFNRKPEVKE